MKQLKTYLMLSSFMFWDIFWRIFFVCATVQSFSRCSFRLIVSEFWRNSIWSWTWNFLKSASWQTLSHTLTKRTTQTRFKFRNKIWSIRSHFSLFQIISSGSRNFVQHSHSSSSWLRHWSWSNSNSSVVSIFGNRIFSCFAYTFYNRILTWSWSF